MIDDEPCVNTVNKYIVWYILYVVLVYNWRTAYVQYMQYDMTYLYVILYGCKNYTHNIN